MNVHVTYYNVHTHISKHRAKDKIKKINIFEIPSVLSTLKKI